MDATVEQVDGYRFAYLLPLDAETIFIEDTCFGDSPDIDVPAARARIRAYAGAQVWQAKRAARSEEHTSELQALLPISYAVFCLKTQHKQREVQQSKWLTDN